MKKCIIALLCLLLVLPLNVFAEESNNQPETQNPSQFENQNSNQLGDQNPDQSGNQNPDQSGDQNPDQSGDQNPDQSGDQNPDQSGDQNPDQSGDQNPDQSGDQNPNQSGDKDSDSSDTNPSESKPLETVPSDHTHVWDVSYTIPATCLEEGATAYGCSTCGAIHVEVLPKLTIHTYDNACDPHCNICDIIREVPHKNSISKVWSKNSSGHWHACSACGAQEDFGKHYPGPAATEEKAQICLTCGYTLTAKLSHNHKYETKWTSDDTGHWYACSGCDDQKDFAVHSYDNPCDPDCNVCGHLSATAHRYSGSWFSDEEYHWDVCLICQEESAREPHIPGSEATDLEAQVCLTCGFELTGALEHLHKGEGDWRKDEEGHWQLCICGSETETLPHVWDAGQEQEDTTTLYTCTDCGFSRIEGEPKKDTHVNPLIWIGVIIVALLAAAAALLFLVIPKGGKGGKYRK